MRRDLRERNGQALECSECAEQSLKPYLFQGAEVAAVSSMEGLQVSTARVGFCFNSVHRWEAHDVDQRNQQNTTNPAVEVTERVNPLKPPVGPSQYLRDFSKTPAVVAQTLGEVITELANVHMHLEVAWWSMCSDLNVPVSKPACPIREQVTG
jgi:hypothetical protein